MDRKSHCTLLGCLIAVMCLCACLAVVVNAQSGVSVPQAVYDELARQGYDYPEIVRAYGLSLTLESSPLEILKFKPKDLSWEEYGAKLQTYKKLRRVMTAMDNAAKTGVKLTTAEGYDLTNVATKRDVIVALHGADPGATKSLKDRSFTDEQTLALITVASIYRRSDLQLAAELTQKAEAEWRSSAMVLITQLNQAVHLT